MFDDFPEIQSSTFGSIAFELYDWGQVFQMCFHKLLAIVCRNVGLFLLTELVYFNHLSEAP